jgi:aminopeptidase N
MSDQFSAPVKRIADVRTLRATQFRDDAGPLAHPVRPASYLEINNFYTTTIYEKGAEVVRMIRTLIGRQGFRRGMELYISKNDNSAATVEDFVAAMQEAAPERNLSQIMRWYAQAGTPEVAVTERYNAQENLFTLTFSQHTNATPGQSEKEPFLIPVAMGLLDEEGRELFTETLVLSESEQSFSFPGINTSPTPSLFRDFSAPIKLKGLSRVRLAFLAAHDTDLFNRWDALQQYASLVLRDAVAAHQAGQNFTLDQGLLEAIAATLQAASRDAAFAAEALLLPTESLLADDMTVVDPDAIHAVREATRGALGRALAAEFAAAYDGFGHEPAHDNSGAAMAGRALKNAALAYLTAAGDASRAAAQFAAARNMTDTLAALSNLADTPGPAREAALAAFYERWQATPLVLDKWFAVQARSAAPDTLERVQALTAHEKFDMRNPNRVRALIASFTGNAAKFHDASGAGYTLLADMVLHLDATNPQIAARLVTALGTWRRFDAARQNLMREALERILAREPLSHNTFEMTSKALA